MRLLSRRKLRVRLLLFGALAAVFMGIVLVAESVVSTATDPGVWTAVAAILGISGVASLERWRRMPPPEDQAEWQPALLLRILSGALGFQAGVLGYFVSGDLTAAAVGVALFLGAIAVAVWLLRDLVFAEV
jgi:hypothetical protein